MDSVSIAVARQGPGRSAAGAEHLDPDHLDAEQHGAGILGPDRTERDQAGLDPSAIEVKVHERPKRRGMLDEEAPAGPLIHARFPAHPRCRCIVVGQPDHGHVECGERGGGVEVSTILSLPDQQGPATLELGDLAHVHECPERQAVDRVAFPGDTGAMVAKQGFRTVERQLGLFPLTEHQPADPAHHVDHALGMRRIEPQRQVLGPTDQRIDALWRTGCQPWTDGRLPWRGPREIRNGSPARRARSSPRVWKSAPRIGSMTLSPATADQHRSMRVRSSAETCVSSRDWKRRPRSRSMARWCINESKAACGVEGMLSPSGPRIVRNSASPSSTWPLIRSWVEARRFSSRVSAAVAPTAACR